MRRRRIPSAFTLVELLVVIGIIAVLISVLLPALNSARRAANAVKCATALREIGNAVQMYLQENKGYVPPARLNFGTGITNYNLYGADFAANRAYWFNFLAKYVTKTKVGLAPGANNSAAAAEEAVRARKSIFWGCPSWDGYTLSSSTNPGDLSAVQTGYGWNAFPEYTPSFPGHNVNLNDNPTYANNIAVPTLSATGITAGKWYKISTYSKPSERVLISDALFWLLQTERTVDDTGKLHGCRLLSNSGAITTTGATTCDWYRHGKYGGKTSDGLYFSATSGKPSYNVLFADGHVTTTNDRANIYRWQRQRFPG